MAGDTQKTTFVFLGGDTYPDDRFVEHALRARLPGHVTGQMHLFQQHNHGGLTIQIENRLRILRAYLADRAPGSVVLVGRSSGARVATLLASEADAHSPVRAVACLAYPFRHPAAGDEPARYRHLAHLRTPTLIVQGRDDLYGGAFIGFDYALSASVRTLIIDAEHRMQLSPQGWDEVAGAICDLAAESGRHRPALAA